MGDTLLLLSVGMGTAALFVLLGYYIATHQSHVVLQEYSSDEEAFRRLCDDIRRARRSVLIVARAHRCLHTEVADGAAVARLLSTFTLLLREKARQRVSIEVVLASSPPMFLVRLARDGIIVLSTVREDHLVWTGRIIDQRTVEIHGAWEEGLAPTGCHRRAERMETLMVEYLRGSKTTEVPTRLIDVVA